MGCSSSPIFRGQALSRLSTPEDLDTLLVVVRPRGWVAYTACLLVCIAALGWAVCGRISVTIEGIGVLVNPGNVKGLQADAAGQLTELAIRAGQHVNKGDVLARLSQPEIHKEITLAGAKLADLTEQDQALSELEKERWDIEQKTAANQTNLLQDEIQKSRQLADSLRSRSEGYHAQQRANLDKSKKVSERLFAAFQERFETAQNMRRGGAISIDVLLESETKLRDMELTLAGHDVQLSELEVLDIESDKEYQRQQNRIADLARKQQETEIGQQRLRQELLEKKSNREREIKETRRRIERLQLDLAEQSEVRSEFTGRVLDVSVTAGQVIAAGARLGAIEIDDTNGELKNLAYFAIQDGKRIQPGMVVHVTPSTVQRARFGSIIGRVTKCSDFPITTETVVNMVGNQEVASQLAQQGGVIEVEVALQRDRESASGYKWTSRGPDAHFSAGTTTHVAVTAEDRAPITWLIPLLRSWIEGKE